MIGIGCSILIFFMARKRNIPKREEPIGFVEGVEIVIAGATYFSYVLTIENIPSKLATLINSFAIGQTRRGFDVCIKAEFLKSDLRIGLGTITPIP